MVENRPVLAFILSCSGVLSLAPTQQVHSELSGIQAQITKLVNQTESLAREVQSKNDLTQFLQGDVRALNMSLGAEKQKNANLEARVATLETQLQNTMTSFGETQGDLRSTKTLVRSLQTQLTSTDAKLNRLVADQTHLNMSYTQTINTLNSSIFAAVQNSQKDPDVYFSTRGLNVTSNFASGSPLQYRVILSNTGNGYDSSSGVFTAPSSGIYWFSVTLSGTTDDHVSCYLVKNSSGYLMEVYISALSAYSSSSTSTVIDLVTGDKITVSQCSGSGHLSSYKSSFSGFLV